MSPTVTITAQESQKRYEVPMGSTLSEILPLMGHESHFPTLAAYANNKIHEMHRRIYEPSTIRFIDIDSYAGFRVYQRTISFVLQRACEELFPERKLYIRHSLGLGGLYCEIEGYETLPEEIVERLEAKMREFTDADHIISSKRVPTQDACNWYTERGYLDKVQLLKTRPRLYSQVYELDSTVGYMYGAMAPSTSYVSTFKLKVAYKGFSLLLPRRDNPSVIAEAHSEMMYEIFHEYQSWVNRLGVPTVGSLNEKVLAGDSGELIKIAEALHEKRLSNIADSIMESVQKRGVRMVLLSGPSSSGKTTTSKRLGIHLKVLGLNPVLISLDDYFVNRDQTPRDENGEYDFEALEAVDVPHFNDHLNRLFAGESVDIPRYDFISGTRQHHEKPLTLERGSILIVEGIHALNPNLIPNIEANLTFKMYVSCITSMAMDSTSRISTTDVRLLRRLIRDYATRGKTAENTLSQWVSVRKGEEKHIFPYQKHADAMFNTSLMYEISILKSKAEPILREVCDTHTEYDNARRLIKFLDNFAPIDPAEIPSTSLLREFIGGSSFNY